MTDLMQWLVMCVSSFILYYVNQKNQKRNKKKESEIKIFLPFLSYIFQSFVYSHNNYKSDRKMYVHIVNGMRDTSLSLVNSGPVLIRVNEEGIYTS